MADFIGYELMSILDNGYTGYLVESQCCVCRRKFGSIQEARECEKSHITLEIINDLVKEFTD